MTTFLVGWGVLSVLLIIFAVVRSAKKKKVDDLGGLIATRTKEVESVEQWQKIYFLINRAPVLGALQGKLFRVMVRIGTETQEDAQVSTAKAFTKTIFVYLGIVLVTIFVLDLWYAQLSFLLAGIFVVAQLQSGAIDKQVKESRDAQIELIEELKHTYLDSLNIISCFSHCADTLEGGAAIYAAQIRDALTAKNPEAALEDYFDLAPSPTMQKLAELSNMISVYGEPGDGSLVYSDTLDRLHEELWERVNDKLFINAALGGLTFMTALPTLGIEFIIRWTQSSFPMIDGFFDSRNGIYTVVLILLSCFITMAGLRLIRVEPGSIEEKFKEEGTFARTLLKNSLIKKLMNNYAPDHGRTERSLKAVQKASEILDSASSKISVHEFYLNKLVAGVFVFIAVLGIQIFGQEATRTVILDERAYQMVPETTTENLEKMRRVFLADFVKAHANTGKSDEELNNLALLTLEENRGILREIPIEDYVLIATERVRFFEAQVFKWTNLLFAFIGLLVGYSVPVIFMLMRSYVRSLEIDREIDSLYTVAGILSRMDQILVQEILESLHRYSNIFKDPFMRAIASYEFGAEKALEQLKEETKQKALTRLADRLLKAVRDIPVRDAFSDLNRDRGYMLEERRRKNRETLEMKASIAKRIGAVPVAAVFIGCIMVPFGFYMIEVLSGMSNVFELLGGG